MKNTLKRLQKYEAFSCPAQKLAQKNSPQFGLLSWAYPEWYSQARNCYAENSGTAFLWSVCACNCKKWFPESFCVSLSCRCCCGGHANDTHEFPLGVRVWQIFCVVKRHWATAPEAGDDRKVTLESLCGHFNDLGVLGSVGASADRMSCVLGWLLEEDKRATTNVQNGWVFFFLFSFKRP